MNFAIFCAAVWVAVICAAVEGSPQNNPWSNPPLEQPLPPELYDPLPYLELQKRSVDYTNPQNQASDTIVRTISLDIKPQPQPPATVVFWQPTSPPPTTTVDPMCPEGKNGACRELPPGQQGNIQVRNDGLVTLQFFVEYKVRGQKIMKESRPFTWTLRRDIDIPADAEDVSLKVQGIGLFGITSDILKRQWKYPVIRCYSSVDAINVNQVGCH